MSAIVVPAEYGYVILSAVFTIFVAVFLGVRVGGARKKYNFPLPLMYDNQNAKNPFNAVQRGHQNLLESHYQFMFCLLVSGLRYPCITAGMGVSWGIGRILFALDYDSAKPENRYSTPLTPILMHIPFLASILGTVAFALQLLNLI